MGRARPQSSSSVILCAATAILVALAPEAAASLPPGLLKFDPFYGDAPRNDSLRPSVSKDAFTDRSLLPYQILGILGGYVFFTLFVFIALFTCGRRWRRSAQSSHGTLAMEMVKPNRWIADASPAVKSVSSFRNWGRSSNAQTPIERSPNPTNTASFDAAAIQNHKEKNELEMERLFAAVMDADTKSPRSVRSASMKSVSTRGEDVVVGGGNAHGHSRTLSNSSRSFSQRRPPQLKGQNGTTAPTSPGSPPTTASLYPPYGPMPSDPNAPVFSVKDAVAHSQYHRTASPRSFHSHTRQPSDTSIRSRATANSTTITSPTAPTSASTPRGRKSKNARSARNLTISAPMPTNKYPGDAADDDEARTPLTPREFASQMGSPGTPHGQGRPVTPIEDHSNAEEEDDDDGRDEYDYDGLDRRRPLPAAAPQRNNGTGGYDPKSPPPLPPPPQDLQSNAAAASSTNTLPFRAYSNTNTAANAAGAGPSGGSTRSSATVTASSPTKTTMISPRRERLPSKSHAQAQARAAHAQQQEGGTHPLGFVGMTSPSAAGGGGLYSAGLSTGGLSGPGTPYSPYMPFSPVTPVTPRLVTREERKRRRREEGRKVATEEEDGVRGEREIWGGGWE